MTDKEKELNEEQKRIVDSIENVKKITENVFAYQSLHGDDLVKYVFNDKHHSEVQLALSNVKSAVIHGHYLQ